MANNVRSDRTSAICKGLAVLLCALMALAGFFIGSSKETCLRMDRGFDRKIYKFDDLAKYGESLFNDNIILMNDIHITDPNFNIGSKDHPFIGTFDGNGHKVYFDFGKVSGSNSLFGALDKQGVVKNTSFVYSGLGGAPLTVESGNYGIVNINNGTVENCRVEFKTGIKLGVDGVVSPLVADNRGTINGIFVVGKLDRGNANEGEVTFGGICAKNSGTVKSALSQITFENFIDLEVFNKDAGKISFLIGENNGIVEKVGYVKSAELNVGDVRITDVNTYTDITKALEAQEQHKNYLFNTFYWLNNGNDMVLKPGSSMEGKK